MVPEQNYEETDRLEMLLLASDGQKSRMDKSPEFFLFIISMMSYHHSETRYGNCGIELVW